MTDWTAGYVADIGYTYGYYTELNPLRINLAFLNAGLAVPEYGNACELGFGQGVSANMHAAATVTQWDRLQPRSGRLCPRTGAGVWCGCRPLRRSLRCLLQPR